MKRQPHISLLFSYKVYDSISKNKVNVDNYVVGMERPKLALENQNPFSPARKKVLCPRPRSLRFARNPARSACGIFSRTSLGRSSACWNCEIFFKTTAEVLLGGKN